MTWQTSVTPGKWGKSLSSLKGVVNYTITIQQCQRSVKTQPPWIDSKPAIPTPARYCVSVTFLDGPERIGNFLAILHLKCKNTHKESLCPSDTLKGPWSRCCGVR